MFSSNISKEGRYKRTERCSAFCTAERVGGRVNHCRMSDFYNEHSMFACTKWHRIFREGRVSFQDDAKHPQHPPYSADLSPRDFIFLES